jgi:hypothetical protein
LIFGELVNPVKALLHKVGDGPRGLGGFELSFFSRPPLSLEIAGIDHFAVFVSAAQPIDEDLKSSVQA